MRRFFRLISRLHSCLFSKFVALLARGLTHLKTRRTRARQRRELSGMSHQELTDLGIGRCEIPGLME